MEHITKKRSMNVIEVLVHTCGMPKNYIPLYTKNFSERYNPPGSYEKMLYSDRVVSMKDVRKQSLTLMPGFKLSWYYSGMKVEPYPFYKSYYDKKTFVRNNSMQKQNK